MELNLQDKYELAKAAGRCTDREFALWLLGVTELFEGEKRNVPCPPYRPNGSHPVADGQSVPASS